MESNVETSTSSYIPYFLGLIIFLIILITIVYFYQINARNLPATPLITDFGVQITTPDFKRLANIQRETLYTGSVNHFDNFTLMMMTDSDVVAGEGTSGWILESLNSDNPDIVALKNGFTGGYMAYNLDPSGNVLFGGVLTQISSRPVYALPGQIPPGSGGLLGWFTRTKVGSTINPKTTFTNTIITLQAVSKTNYFLSIGPQDPTSAVSNFMMIQPDSPQLQKNFVISY